MATLERFSSTTLIGNAFATRAEALAAIYEYGSEFCAEEAEGIGAELNGGPTP